MKKNLDEKELDAVTGGNYGDSETEYADTPEGVKYLYNVGDHVEVFRNAGIHIHTYGATIMERSAQKTAKGCDTVYYGYYKVEYDDNQQLDWVSAEQIERN